MASVYIQAVRLLLKPIVRICLRSSLKIQDFIAIAKEVFVEVAGDELKRSSATENQSRLSVVTGLHRRDITRLTLKRGMEKAPENLLTKVLGQWQGDKRFLTKRGTARALSVEGKQSEFMELVRSVSNDLNPYTVLFELERIGVVARKKHLVTLTNEIYSPKGNIKQGLAMLSSDVSDLVEGVTENIFSELEIPNLHIRTEYDNIGERDLPKIRSWLVEQGEQFHKQAREYLSRFDRDINPKRNSTEDRVRVKIGTFSRIEDMASEKIPDVGH